MTAIDMDKETTHAHLGMVLRAVILGLSFSLVGLMNEGLPPLLLTALRFTIAAIALLPLVWRMLETLPGPRAIALYGLMGFCQAFFFGAMFWVAHRIGALSMTILYVSAPLFAYGVGLLLRVEQPRRLLIGVLPLGAGGALALAWADAGGALGGLRIGAPEAVYFAGCLAMGLYPVLAKWGLSRRLISEWAGVRTFWSLVAGAVLVGTVGLVKEKPLALAALRLSDALLLAYLGVFSTGVSFWLMQRAAAVLTPGATVAYTYLLPFVSMLLLFLTEPHRISWHRLPGTVLVALAMALLLRGDAARNPAVPAR